MSWTVDVKATTEARIAQLPVSFAAAVEAALSRPAVQQPSWPDAEQAARVVGVLEGVPPIAVASEVDLLQGRLAAVARGEAFLCRAAIARDLPGQHRGAAARHDPNAAADGRGFDLMGGNNTAAS